MANKYDIIVVFTNSKRMVEAVETEQSAKEVSKEYLEWLGIERVIVLDASPTAPYKCLFDSKFD